jgi:hypothetical protein
MEDGQSKGRDDLPPARGVSESKKRVNHKGHKEHQGEQDGTRQERENGNGSARGAQNPREYAAGKSAWGATPGEEGAIRFSFRGGAPTLW